MSWYRYHHLFADLLRQRLQRERRDLVPELHRRASEWYEEHGLIPEAVGQALASGDFERAACLIEWTAWAMLTRGEMITLLGWLDALADNLVRSRPQLGILHAWALALTGQLDGVESHLPDVDVQRVPGDLAAVRAYVASHRGDMRRVIEFCHQAFERLPEEKWFSRGIVAVILGTAPLKSGDPVAASRALAEAVRLNQTDGRTYLTLIATTMLGEAQEMQGLLRQAVQTHRQALQLASEQGSRPAPSAGMAYVGIAGPLYEWNDLDGAMRYAMKGIELSEQGGSVDTMEDGYINLAQVHQARGDVDQAFEMIREVDRLAQRYNHGYWMAVATEIRARLWVRRGNIAAASRWAQERRLSGGDRPEYTREFEHIAAVRVLIARALSQASPREGEIGEALRLLARLLEAAEAARRMGSVIKILALQALAFQARGDVGQALSVLERALSLAEPEGYVRTFVDEGEPMARLLRRALSQGITPNYVARLMAALGETAEPSLLRVKATKRRHGLRGWTRASGLLDRIGVK